jgi:hypothetical protein
MYVGDFVLSQLIVIFMSSKKNFFSFSKARVPVLEKHLFNIMGLVHTL